jgi:hypothetical protein
VFSQTDKKKCLSGMEADKVKQEHIYDFFAIFTKQQTKGAYILHSKL